MGHGSEILFNCQARHLTPQAAIQQDTMMAPLVPRGPENIYTILARYVVSPAGHNILREYGVDLTDTIHPPIQQQEQKLPLFAAGSFEGHNIPAVGVGPTATTTPRAPCLQGVEPPRISRKLGGSAAQTPRWVPGPLGPAPSAQRPLGPWGPPGGLVGGDPQSSPPRGQGWWCWSGWLLQYTGRTGVIRRHL